MNTSALKNVSVLGRACSTIMCTEEYLMAIAPEKDWTPLREIMWSTADDALWDGWLGEMIEIIPENMHPLRAFGRGVAGPSASAYGG